MAKIIKSTIALISILSLMGMVFMPVALAEEMSFTGVISPEGILQTDEGQEFTLSDNQLKQELMDHVGKRVDVKGAVSEGADGKMIIEVQEYQLLQ